MTYTQRCTRCGQEWSGFFGLCNQCKILDEQAKAMGVQRELANAEENRQWQLRAANTRRREQQEFVQSVYDTTYKVSVTDGGMSRKEFKEYWNRFGDMFVLAAQGFANDKELPAHQTSYSQEVSFLSSIWSGIKSLVKWTIYGCIFIVGLILIGAAVG